MSGRFFTMAAILGGLSAGAAPAADTVDDAFAKYGTAENFGAMIVFQTIGEDGLPEGASQVSFLDYQRPGLLSIVSEDIVVQSDGDRFVAQSLSERDYLERPAPATLSSLDQPDFVIAANLAKFPIVDFLSANRAAISSAPRHREVRQGRPVVRIALDSELPTEIVIDEATATIVATRTAISHDGSRWYEATYNDQKFGEDAAESSTFRALPPPNYQNMTDRLMAFVERPAHDFSSDEWPTSTGRHGDSRAFAPRR